MPRITKEDKARNRQNIVEAAGRMFRAQGIDTVGIADLMKEAGLTHGGFYNHFASKDDLAAEVCNASFAASLGVLEQAVEEEDDPGGPPLRRVVDDYLSVAHRDAPDGGCPSASLVTDAGRHNDTIQRSYAAGVEGYLAGFAAELAREQDGESTPQQARDRAVLLLSRLVGAMVLARAVRHVRPGLSDEILRTCRAHALD
ncbi:MULTISPECIES: TetR/AcrR family transcriptional regulator [Streptomyces]|uniref:TetR/AcrR family transcriptional regulator n=2 Tax=Streptomyces TaxID=1883 RepID=A0A3R7FL89_9ACTN|nr:MULTISPECIES: TetR/AcrR family transcriptional regulator [Streptomyces]KNE80561.1 TetR family transcriptional regulator [Streptomyces fradiae]OFA41592.1 TetR family transcriptional regulator [Streptomyces fradiae]PQM25344.1 TetR/AcrR family transcriptional regulator [Streptomyces xinghaiensis]RKM99398.1 TetR/AcrR family transcriptional regulator [Streptomyces xinghaiensis]RNC75698.1 TetR/AcrR family transcriptional regulator [Streptomyces xinghaiensis]